MSHDQRPGKMRVTRDTAAASAQTPQRRQEDLATTGATGAAAAAADAPAKGGSGFVPGALFLIACIAGGVGVAFLMPFGG